MAEKRLFWTWWGNMAEKRLFSEETRGFGVQVKQATQNASWCHGLCQKGHHVSVGLVYVFMWPDRPKNTTGRSSKNKIHSIEGEGNQGIP